MLIEFSVANFRSIREKQTFSMVAAPRLKKRENVFIPDVEGERLPALLKVAAVYGPNASGKSNLIEAFNVVPKLTRIDGERTIPVSPFRFDPALMSAASEFEINFIANRQRYTFEVSCTPERITRECLIVYPKGKESLLYERTYKNAVDEYVFGGALEGGAVLHDAWKKLTGPKTLFLAQAVANSNEELRQLRPPFDWFAKHALVIAPHHMGAWAESTQKLAADLPKLSTGVSQFLQEIDVPVTNIEVIKPTINSLGLSNNFLSGMKNYPWVEKSKTTLTHTTALGEALFDYSEESTGTQNLIGFFIPWMQLNLRTTVLFVDELDSSLHPEIVATLVSKHIKSENSSQLIFTTHDTHLMDAKLMRRDQFWITERDENGATQLRSIHDFEGRESEDIEKRYFEGRYRGLPIIRRD